MEQMDILRKTSVYGWNLIARPIGNLIKEGANLGNPGGAILYSFIDIFRNATPKFKENKYIRLIETGGFGFYTAKTIVDLVSFAKGDFGSLIDLPFDAFMAYEVGKNTIEDYRGKSLKKDIKEIPQDFKKVFDPPKIKSS